MSTIELLEKHPLTTEVVRTWFFDGMIKSFEDQNVPEEFKEIMKQEGVTNERLATLIDVNPRVLFDVFDENGLYIHIVPFSSEKEKMIFLIGIDTLETLDDTPSTQYSTRKEAECVAIEKAFEILENELSPKEEK